MGMSKSGEAIEALAVHDAVLISAIIETVESVLLVPAV